MKNHSDVIHFRFVSFFQIYYRLFVISSFSGAFGWQGYGYRICAYTLPLYTGVCSIYILKHFFFSSFTSNVDGPKKNGNTRVDVTLTKNFLFWLMQIKHPFWLYRFLDQDILRSFLESSRQKCFLFRNYCFALICSIFF